MGETKVYSDGCGLPPSEHEVLFRRRAIVETLARSLMGVENFGPFFRQAPLPDPHQGCMTPVLIG